MNWDWLSRNAGQITSWTLAHLLLAGLPTVVGLLVAIPLGALANRYRDALREARDPEAMLAVGRALIADVEDLAGSERADGISERLAKLLPAGLLENSI